MFPTIISQNCIGGLMSHDLGLKFCSPTVNLYMEADDYIRFLEKLDYYLSLDGASIRFIETDRGYPVGYLDDVKMFFVHFHTEAEVVEKWNERRKRVNYDDMYVIMTDRDGCTDEIYQRYAALQYKHKVFFSHAKRQDDFTVFMPCFADKSQVGSLTEFCSIWGKRYYAKYFDYVKWLGK